MLFVKEQLIIMLVYLFIIVPATGNKSKADEKLSAIKKSYLENKDKNKERSLPIFGTIKTTKDTVHVEESLCKEDKVISFNPKWDKSIRNVKPGPATKISVTTESDSSTVDADAIVFPTENTAIFNTTEDVDDRFGLPPQVVATMLG